MYKYKYYARGTKTFSNTWFGQHNKIPNQPICQESWIVLGEGLACFHYGLLFTLLMPIIFLLVTLILPGCLYWSNPQKDVEMVWELVVTVLRSTLRVSPLKFWCQVPGWQVVRWWPSSGKGLIDWELESIS